MLLTRVNNIHRILLTLAINVVKIMLGIQINNYPSFLLIFL